MLENPWSAGRKRKKNSLNVSSGSIQSSNQKDVKQARLQRRAKHKNEKAKLELPGKGDLKKGHSQ